MKQIAEWEPPDRPIPGDILQSAIYDARRGAYEQALSKFKWFHSNAAKYARLTAVRPTLALGYWLELVAVYPPARAAFFEIRNTLEAAFRDDPSNTELFGDIALLNRRTNDGNRTANLFLRVSQEDPESAAQIYPIAERYLIEARLFRSCGRFLHPYQSMDVAIQTYQQMKSIEDTAPVGKSQIPHAARMFYIKSSATLVALLVLNDRMDEAAITCHAATEFMNDDDFRNILEVAMNGHVPDRDFDEKH